MIGVFVGVGGRHKTLWTGYVVQENGCWEWVGYTSPQGYGQVGVVGPLGKRTQQAHRFMYERDVGPVPNGLELDHLCRNRACVNPAHLEPVTRKENVMRSPICPTAINAKKTHCPNGHEYDVTNTSNWNNGNRTGRRCRACALIAQRRRAQRIKNGEIVERWQVHRQTHCLRGHAFDEKNTFVRPMGKRACRACMAIHRLKWVLVHEKGWPPDAAYARALAQTANYREGA